MLDGVSIALQRSYERCACDFTVSKVTTHIKEEYVDISFCKYQVA
jgi:hypothetical protein